jgi:hypothetical protein
MVAGLISSAVALSLITRQLNFLLAILPIIVVSVVLGPIRYVNDAQHYQFALGECRFACCGSLMSSIEVMFFYNNPSQFDTTRISG